MGSRSSPSSTRAMFPVAFVALSTLGAGRGGKYVAKLLSGGTKDGHSLRELYARELGMELDEREQAGDWSRRPLTETQVAYAALDAKVLLRLHEHFERAGAPRRDKAQT